VQTTLFHGSPQFAYGFRRWLLRSFGARVGQGAIIRPSVTVTYPWKVSIGDHAWVGDDVVLYSLGENDIGAHAVVSQSSYLCASDHDYTQPDFPIRARKITIGPEAWVAADVFVAPGVTLQGWHSSYGCGLQDPDGHH
jgi:putative colanic acid biosynthesis acetyltransferase WcaF